MLSIKPQSKDFPLSQRKMKHQRQRTSWATIPNDYNIVQTNIFVGPICVLALKIHFHGEKSLWNQSTAFLVHSPYCTSTIKFQIRTRSFYSCNIHFHGQKFALTKLVSQSKVDCVCVVSFCLSCQVLKMAKALPLWLKKLRLLQPHQKAVAKGENCPALAQHPLSHNKNQTKVGWQGQGHGAAAAPAKFPLFCASRIKELRVCLLGYRQLVVYSLHQSATTRGPPGSATELRHCFRKVSYKFCSCV